MRMVYKTRIRDLREDCDLKQREIAKLLNCSQTCYSKYEIGEREIPLRLLCQLADYYGVSTDYLLRRTPEKTIRKRNIAKKKIHE